MPKLVYQKKSFSGDVLSIRRQAMGYDRQQLADLVGCSRMAIMNWEIGKFQPRPEHILKLAKVLKLKQEKFSLSEVFSGLSK